MDELLKKVKNSLGITIDDPDINNGIKLKIQGTIGYLNDGGATIPDEDVDYVDITPKMINCIAIGVNDLLNNKAGVTSFSPAFHMFAMQICRG